MRALLTSALILAVLPVSAWAQSTNDNFSITMRMLSSQARFTIVAEGKPLESANRSLQSRVIVRGKGTPRQKLQQLATLYDYDVSTSPGTFVLTKKYTDPAELPCVTYEELKAAFEQINAVTQDLAPRPGSDPRLTQFLDRRSSSAFYTRRFFLDFPESQRQRLAQGIPFGQLSSAQQEAVQGQLGSAYLEGQAINTQYAVNRVTGAANGTLLRRGEGNKSALIIEMVVPGVRRPVKIQQRLQTSGPLQDDEEYRKQMSPEYLQSKGSTIDSLVKQLSQRSVDGTKPTRFEVIPALAKKPIAVFGESYCSPGRIASAVCRLYGLRLQSYPMRTLITREPPPQKVTLANYADALKILVPVPLRHAMSRDTSLVAHAARYLPASLKASTASAKIEERLAEQGIAFRTLTSRQKAAVAILLSGSAIESIARQIERTPTFITSMSNLTIRMRQSTNREGNQEISGEYLLYNPVAQKWDAPLSFSKVRGFD